MMCGKLQECKFQSAVVSYDELGALCCFSKLKCKGKGTERRVAELIPVHGSQPAGDVSHKPGGRLPLLGIKYNRCICI